MQLLKEFYLEDKCSYLQGKNQQMFYQLIDQCDKEHCQELIERGFRRFGKMFFRPVCHDCTECQTVKIDVENYHFSKSAKRVLKKGSDIQTYIQKPTLTQEHLNLFDAYHRYMHQKKGWDFQETSAMHYYQSFVDGSQEFGYEILYFFEERLIGVDLVDILQNGISSIYFYYDPEYSAYSLGRLSLYNQIIYAKERKKRWIYLGYYVQECPSLSYKASYQPLYTLQGRPEIDQPYIYL